MPDTAMRNELRERLANILTTLMNVTTKYAVNPQADRLIAELEAFMREHDPPLKMMTRRKGICWIGNDEAQNCWDAASLAPWQDK